MVLVVESDSSGSLRPLSPTEGKFRVKAVGAASGRWRYFWTGLRSKAMNTGRFGD
jgi:hypothetical protein